MNVGSIKYALSHKFAIWFNKCFSEFMKIIICRTMRFIDRQRDNFIYEYTDYIRLSSLELVAEEINTQNILGCVAEVGVFCGDFARHINALFPYRKLYLFDTFEGFDERDVAIELNKEYSKSYIHESANKNIELVLEKMKYRDNCIVKKGYFPKTANNLDEKYVFVSIDVDLYKPIYDGLCYFYPRLEKGGFIFVHDYNNKGFKGTKEAVQKYSQENNIPYFPLSDTCGSVVFMK